MKIALSGPQGVGKTTILNKMKNDSWFQKMNLEYIQEIVRNIVKKYNIKINDVGNDDSQLLIANTHYFNFFKNNFVTDRCILDNFIYAELLYKKNKIHKWVYDYTLNLLKKDLPKFDYIFYFPPEFEIKDDGFRNIDKYFQLKTHNEFEKYIAIFNFDNVHKITGTVKERIDTIKKIIKKRECNEKFTRHSTTKKRF